VAAFFWGGEVRILRCMCVQCAYGADGIRWDRMEGLRD